MPSLKYLLPLTALLLGSLVALASGPQDSPTASPVSAPVSSDGSLAGELDSRAEMKSFRDLLAQAGLTGRLRSRGPYTLLVPTNQALADDKGLVDELLRPSGRPRLKRLMRFHVLRGRHRFLRDGRDMRSLSSQPVSIAAYRGKGWAEDARLTGRIRANNGYIFTVDRMLVPRGDPAR